MKKALLILLLSCGIVSGAAGQSRLLKALKKGVEVVTEITNTIEVSKKDTIKTTVTETEITETTVEEVPGEPKVTITQGPDYVKVTEIDAGYSLEELSTAFFWFDNSGKLLEAVDTDLFDPGQFVYSLSVGWKDSRFPVERAYAGFSDVVEDERTKDYYMKHRGKCYVAAEKGHTPLKDRETITENYLYLAIDRFVDDNLDEGMAFYKPDIGNFHDLRQVYTRASLLGNLFTLKFDSNQELAVSMSEGQQYYIDYITKYSPRKSRISFMGDDEATAISFEYKFYDMELALHAFVFSPITLHYEVRSWYDKGSDVTIYAYFYCVGYDNENMEKALGTEEYQATKADFKKRNDLDFDEFPLLCMMPEFERRFRLKKNPPDLLIEYFHGPLSYNEEGTSKTKKTVKKTVEKTVVRDTIPVKKPIEYTVSSNSAARLQNIQAIDVAEDAGFIYLAGNINAEHKLFAIDKVTGTITEIYRCTWGNKDDKGEIKRLMNDKNGKVLVQFSKYPVMACYNGALEDTKMRFLTEDRWTLPYYPKLKGIMPNGDVLFLREGDNETMLVDRTSGIIKTTAKIYFGELRNKVDVSAQGVIWEPGPGCYMHVTGLGTAPQPTSTRFDTGSILKGNVNDISIAPDGTIFLTSRYGLHRSSDEGKTWKTIKSIYDYGSFMRVAPAAGGNVWVSTDSSQGQCVVKYDKTLDKIIFRTSQFDVPGKDGAKLKLETAPLKLFVDSADNLWIIGGTYTNPGVTIFNPGGIMGYSGITSGVEMK